MTNIKQQRNTPVVTLIKNYVDKRSGKVAESRKEIQKRFDYLDWKDQKKILLAFLDSGKTDRQWAYLKLLNYWDKSFEPKVKALWESLHEPQCSWSIIRFFPLSYVMENMESFKGKRDYYFICIRLAEDPNYVIDRTKLRAIDYLSVLYHSGRSLSSDEANGILFEIVHDMCVAGFDLNDLEHVDFAKGMFSPTDFRSINLAKYYLREMNYSLAGRIFDEWNQKVQRNISQSPEYRVLKGYDESLYLFDLKVFIVRKYAYLALDDQYKKPSDTCMNELKRSEEWKRLTAPENVLHRTIASPHTYDSLKLDSLAQSNPPLKRLIDVFDLEIEDGPPF